MPAKEAKLLSRLSVYHAFPGVEYKATDAVRAVGPKVGTLSLIHNHNA